MGTGATNMSTTQQPEALAADHSEQNLEMVARWYMIDKDGVATLCTDREDAEKEAKNANMAWPHTAPHRAVQLVEVADVGAMRTGYAAARLEIESLRARGVGPDVSGYVSEWSGGLCTSDEAMDGIAKLYAAQPAAPQQEAQEPVAWYVTGCSRLLDEDEAKAEARHIGGMARAMPLYTAPKADSVLEDTARLERERICAAIKAEDDYCVDHGGYMLDSDDCIKIVRGEWVRPDFSVAAARKQGGAA